MAFLSECEECLGRRLLNVVSPMQRIEPVEFGADLDSYRTFIFTSRHAVLRISDNLAGRFVKTVGQRTAHLAAEYGASAECLGENVDEFVENVHEVRAPAVYFRGVHSRGNLKTRAARKGVSIQEVVVYDQVKQSLSRAGQSLLVSGSAVVPLFSPRSAHLLSRYGASPNTIVLAISGAAASEWHGNGHIEIARRPTKEEMLDMVVAAF
ncbi:MAG: uroporphyrinogen-III synthase [Pseudomonadota bacterium]